MMAEGAQHLDTTDRCDRHLPVCWVHMRGKRALQPEASHGLTVAQGPQPGETLLSLLPDLGKALVLGVPQGP